ncbi:SRPBCC family protein [Actinoallomurus sp. NPDC050550]|uniref:SRPBCC family protein n=1 Tax=Actinoallomurus sp. NPDC050550 TaxID=3154937 RepID=UPI0033FDC1B9
MGFHVVVDIGCPSAEVFAFLTDFRNMPRWYTAVERVSARPGGSGFRMVRSLPGGPAHNDVEMITHRPNEEVTFVSVNGPTPFRYRYRVEPVPGGTRLTLDGEISGEGLPGPAVLLGGLAERLFRQGMTRNLRALKHILEGRE